MSVGRAGALIALQNATRTIALEGLRVTEIVMNPYDADEMLLGLRTTDRCVVPTDTALQWRIHGVPIQQNPWLPRGKIWIYPPGITITIRCNEHEDCRECQELAEECWASRTAEKRSTDR